MTLLPPRWSAGKRQQWRRRWNHVWSSGGGFTTHNLRPGGRRRTGELAHTPTPPQVTARDRRDVKTCAFQQKGVVLSHVTTPAQEKKNNNYRKLAIERTILPTNSTFIY